ncbi:MAG: hypothetical protein LBC63_00490 [Holophagales bacterium]|jgi:hypothetical protein|nr:hypothetical protein [Holophagales bacterium]
MQTAEKPREDGIYVMTNRAALLSDAPSDSEIFLKMLGFTAFSKTLA